MNAAFPRVLVVDDEDAIRELLEYGLTGAGFDVRSAPDGRAALSMMEKWTPEAIVLDVMLPGIDGFSLLPALRRVTDVPIILLTARLHTEDKVTGLYRGADDYLAKPFEMDELVARLHARLRRPRLESPICRSTWAAETSFAGAARSSCPRVSSISLSR
jgi:DNA-binding response OmpR family regulator